MGRKRSIKKARMISRKKYETLVKKKRSRKRLTKKEKKQLENALFVNYCKCIKKGCVKKRIWNFRTTETGQL